MKEFMMREIKFRVWDKGFKLEDVTYFSLPVDEGVTSRTLHLKVGDVLDQYAGTRDKDGVEVYHGDILRVDDDGIVYNSTVKYEEGVLCIDVEGREYQYIPPQWLDGWVEFQVIGNIYENKELLYE